MDRRSCLSWSRCGVIIPPADPEQTETQQVTGNGCQDHHPENDLHPPFFDALEVHHQSADLPLPLKWWTINLPFNEIDYNVSNYKPL